MTTATDFEVVVVGAGLAGSSAAASLGMQGLRVALVDPRPVYAPAFKAEKIEADQADLFRRLRLMDGILPHAARINAITEAHFGRVLRVVPIEQYGIFYQDMVNAVRRQIPANVTQIAARAERLETSAETQTVELSTGLRLTTRLVVIACGTGGRLHEAIASEKHVVRERHSLCSGFDVARTDGEPFPFESLTYWADSLRDRIDYITFFRIPGRMRINLFSYREPKEPWVRDLANDPRAVIERAMPRLGRLAGDWKVTSRVESYPIDLYVASPSPRDGVVLIGDACQSVCPATGTGVSKVLTDVVQLCLVHVPQWLATPGMSATKIASFYADPRKQEVDRHSLDGAEHRRNFATKRSLRWWLHRKKTYAKIAFEGWRKARGGAPQPAA